MLSGRKHRALIACADSEWREACADTFIECGYDVHTTSTGMEAVEMMRSHRYDAVVADDSLPDLGLVEVMLYAAEFASAAPHFFVAGHDLDRYERVMARCGVSLAGPWDRLLEDIRDAISEGENIGEGAQG